MKKINTDETFKKDLITKFTEYVNNTKFTNNHITFTTEIDTTVNEKNIARPTIYISANAYLKMLLYIRDTDVEIAWHGVVERNQEQNWYHIKDVFLYPQRITAATVNTDQEKYQEWLQNIEDDAVFNNIRFQGHSHVNMGTTPSSTDLNMYDNFLQILPKNDYYIFTIMNKHGNHTWLIYDLTKNIVYETADIDVKIITSNTQDLITEINKEKDEYCERPAPTIGCNSLASSIFDYNSDKPYYSSKTIIPQYNQSKDVNDLLAELDYRHGKKNKKKLK